MLISYFDEGFAQDGRRALRGYSQPVHLDVVFGAAWHAVRGDGGLEHVARFLEGVAHYRLLAQPHLQMLRPSDQFMLPSQVTLREWQPPSNGVHLLRAP